MIFVLSGAINCVIYQSISWASCSFTCLSLIFSFSASMSLAVSLFFFLKNTAPPEFSPLPLPAPLPISPGEQNADRPDKPADHRIGGVQAEPHPAHTGHDGGHGPHDRDEPREDHRPRAETFEEGRSEEHTSELQSQSNLVCRLLLEKKKI